MDFDVIREIIETVSWISTSILAVVAYKALEQIGVAKEASQITAKRDSIKLAAERCDYFDEKITNGTLKSFNDFLKLNDITFLNRSKIDVDLEKETISVQVKINDKEASAFNENVDATINLVNSLELFAIYFTSRIADEELAFHTLGDGYCDLIKRLLPIITTKSFKDHCPHIMGLYFIWQKRLNLIQNQKKQTKLASQLKDLENKTIKVKPNPPIGA